MPSAGSQHRSNGFAALRTSLAVAMFALTLAGSTHAGPLEDATAAQGNASGQNDLERMAGKGRVVAGTSNCKMLQIDQWPVRRRRGWLTIDGAINGQSAGVLLDTGPCTR